MYDHGVVENAVSAVMSMMKWWWLLLLTLTNDDDDDDDDRVRNMTGGATVCGIPISVTSISKNIDGVVVVTFSLEIVFLCLLFRSKKILSLSLSPVDYSS